MGKALSGEHPVPVTGLVMHPGVEETSENGRSKLKLGSQ